MIAKLTQKMASFRYDESRCFRAWLKTITQRVLSDLMASRRRAVGQSGDSALRDRRGPRRSRAADRRDFRPRAARPGDLEGPPASRAGDLGSFSADNFRRMHWRRGVAVARYAGCVGVRVQASRAEAAQGRDSKARRDRSRNRRRHGRALARRPITPMPADHLVSDPSSPFSSGLRLLQNQPAIAVESETTDTIGMPPRTTLGPSSELG